MTPKGGGCQKWGLSRSVLWADQRQGSAGCWDSAAAMPPPFYSVLGPGAVLNFPKHPFQGLTPPELLFRNVILEVRLLARRVSLPQPAVFFTGANCLSRTPMGRTALHVAAAMGRLDCITHLLNHGASVNEKDARGETPMSIARRLNRRHSERRMFLFCWLTRSGTTDPRNLITNKVFHRVKSRFSSKKSQV